MHPSTRKGRTSARGRTRTVATGVVQKIYGNGQASYRATVWLGMPKHANVHLGYFRTRTAAVAARRDFLATRRAEAADQPHANDTGSDSETDIESCSVDGEMAGLPHAAAAADAPEEVAEEEEETVKVEDEPESMGETSSAGSAATTISDDAQLVGVESTTAVVAQLPVTKRARGRLAQAAAQIAAGDVAGMQAVRVALAAVNLHGASAALQHLGYDDIEMMLDLNETEIEEMIQLVGLSAGHALRIKRMIGTLLEMLEG